MARISNTNGETFGQGINGEAVGYKSSPSFEVLFPQRDDTCDIAQDAEIFDVVVKQRIKIHDYRVLFSYPNLYDHVIEKELQCQSPQQLILLLRQYLASDGPNLSRGPLRIIDIAAGNGRVGVELRASLGKQPGISRLVGTDLMESAKLAAMRDRKPYPYDEYVVADLIACSDPAVQEWTRERFDVVTICAALGPGDGDLPLEVVDAVTRFLLVGGLLVFTVNHRTRCRPGGRYEGFLRSLEDSGNKTHWDNLVLVDRKVYQHRLDVKGKAIEYTALIYQKKE